MCCATALGSIFKCSATRTDGTVMGKVLDAWGSVPGRMLAVYKSSPCPVSSQDIDARVSCYPTGTDGKDGWSVKPIICVNWCGKSK